MTIGLIDVDSTIPNLALMKISAWHKAQGDIVEWYMSFNHYDIVYVSKIFKFTKDYAYYINADKIVKGGTGYDYSVKLPDEIDRIQPDYSIYNVPDNVAYGFLTRGCIRKCKWCIVPKKEGFISPYMDIDEISQGGQRTNITLFDNNIFFGGGSMQ